MTAHAHPHTHTRTHTGGAAERKASCLFPFSSSCCPSTQNPRRAAAPPSARLIWPSSTSSRPSSPSTANPCWDPQCTALCGPSHRSFLLLSISRPAAAARRPSMLTARKEHGSPRPPPPMPTFTSCVPEKHSFLLPVRAVYDFMPSCQHARPSGRYSKTAVSCFSCERRQSPTANRKWLLTMLADVSN